MGETPGNEYLTVILSGKFHGNVPAECRRTFPYVHSHIKNRPADYPDQLALGEWRFLEMKPSDNAAGRAALIVLDKSDPADRLIELPLRE